MSRRSQATRNIRSWHYWMSRYRLRRTRSIESTRSCYQDRRLHRLLEPTDSSFVRRRLQSLFHPPLQMRLREASRAQAQERQPQRIENSPFLSSYSPSVTHRLPDIHNSVIYIYYCFTLILGIIPTCDLSRYHSIETYVPYSAALNEPL